MVLTDTKNGLIKAMFRETGGHYELTFGAMGTACALTYSARSRADADRFRVAALEWVAAFEARFSRFRPGSLVRRINEAAGERRVDIDGEMEQFLAMSDWFYWLTGGAFDPSAGPLAEIWDYRRTTGTVPDAAAVEAARARCGWPRVQREPGRVFLPEKGMALDFGGLGKEYAVDKVIEMARHMGIASALVDFGHDLRVFGEPPEKGAWRIGLEDPRHAGRCWCGVAVSDLAVCTSGNYLRYREAGGKRYGHILDPRSGYPADNGCVSVSVIAPSCTEAGVLATAAFVLGPEKGLALLSGKFGVEGCVWTEKEVIETGRFRDYVI